jgi:hypothetical protein
MPGKKKPMTKKYLMRVWYPRLKADYGFALYGGYHCIMSIYREHKKPRYVRCAARCYNFENLKEHQIEAHSKQVRRIVFLMTKHPNISEGETVRRTRTKKAKKRIGV